MDLISGYPSDGEEPLEDTPLQPVQRITHTGLGAKSSAPVSTVAIANTQSLKRSMADGQNVGVDIMLAPEVGPHNPFSGPTASGGGGSIVSKNGIGVVEDTFVEDYAFNSAYQSYLQEDLKLVPKTKQIRTERQPKKAKLMKDLPADIGDESLGPWCDASSLRPVPTGVKRGPQDEEGPEPEAEDNEETAVAEDPSMHILEPDEEDEKWEKVNERKASFVMPPRPVRGSMAGEAKSTFHGPEERDYQGRPWTTAPSGVRPGDGDHDCFIPKKCIKKFVGHSKGVQAIELFPGTGHLLLSGSLDGKCKVWDVMSHRNVMRTYHGHTEAVRSIHMSNDGSQFLSSGFDRYVRLWDLETGQAVGTFSNRKMHYQVKFSPNNNNVFLCASSDNKIYQWDTRSGEVVQEYNYHLQPCNTITFFDDGRKFLSTSDDKKMLVWETDIPVPIKYIAEPDMHSVPSVTVHPSGGFFAGQSLDNTIVTYQCGDRVRQIKKKTFRGHNNSGYACQIGFSPNGQFLASGDGQGKLHFWDFKSTKPYRKLQAHDNGPCMGCVWHPLSPSWVFTCGWDGVIKMWD